MYICLCLSPFLFYTKYKRAKKPSQYCTFHIICLSFMCDKGMRTLGFLMNRDLSGYVSWLMSIGSNPWGQICTFAMILSSYVILELAVAFMTTICLLVEWMGKEEIKIKHLIWEREKCKRCVRVKLSMWSVVCRWGERAKKKRANFLPFGKPTPMFTWIRAGQHLMLNRIGFLFNFVEDKLRVFWLFVNLTSRCLIR